VLASCVAPRAVQSIFDPLDSDGCSYIGENEFLCAIDDLRLGVLAELVKAELGLDNNGLIFYIIRIVQVLMMSFLFPFFGTKAYSPAGTGVETVSKTALMGLTTFATRCWTIYNVVLILWFLWVYLLQEELDELGKFACPFDGRVRTTGPSCSATRAGTHVCRVPSQ
jgi:hypothetical protein